MIAAVMAFALLTGPVLCRAQVTDDSQNPKEYTDDDSNPLKMIFYILSPVGFALEWTIARPMHYLATESSLAPAFGGGNDESNYANAFPPAPIAELPPSDMAPSRSSELEGPASSHGSPGEPASSQMSQPSVGGAPSSVPSAPTQQPVLH
ncbi:MAG: hypothetical protein ABSD31_05025 [Candidatus Binataceae bacterium]